MAQPRIYLDHAATTPLIPAARAAMAAALEHWHNPSSPHAEGRAAKAALEDARRRVRAALGWGGEVIFTSGASEALAIALGRTDRPVLASSVEHDAVYRAAPNAVLLPLHGSRVAREPLEAALRERAPAIVAIQHINSETGIEQPVEDYAAIVRANGGYLVSDCSQSAGKVPLPDADMIVLSAHKLGGPPGVGALLVQSFDMIAATGGQEFGYRAGTQNLPAILGFAAALESVKIGQFDYAPRGALPMAEWLAAMGDAVLDLQYPIQRAGGAFQPEARDFGPDAPRFAGWINAITMPGVSATSQLVRFDAAGIAVSIGSACSSGTLKPSRTLKAFGVSDEDAACTIRVSFGWSNTADDLRTFLDQWLAMAAGARRAA